MTISGFENIICIEKFEYMSCIDRHDVCSFSACVKSEDVEAMLAKLDTDVDYEDNDFKFTGHITNISVSNDISGMYIEVESIGKTYLYDQDRYSRVFQQGDKAISDILSNMKSMSDVAFQNAEDPTIESIIFQDGMTEWDFMVQLVNRYGMHIFPHEKAFIARYGSNQMEVKDEQLIDYRIYSKKQKTCMICKIDFSIDLGSQVKYSDKLYYVEEKKYFLDKEKYYFEYVLDEIIGEVTVEPDIINTYLYAKVTDNNDPDKKGRLQVNFENEVIEDCMKDSPIWIDRIDLYASKGLGPVYIPKIDDMVMVHLFKGDTKIVGCIRTEAYGKPYENCDDKYLLIDEDVYIQYEDGKISLHNKKNVVDVSGEEITISSGEKISVSLSNDKVLIRNDKAAIEITADVNVSSNKMVVEAKGDASITGTNVNIKGKNGVSVN